MYNLAVSLQITDHHESALDTPFAVATPSKIAMFVVRLELTDSQNCADIWAPAQIDHVTAASFRDN